MMRTGSRMETPRGDAGYPYDTGHPLQQSQPTATPLRNATPLRYATPLGSKSTPLGNKSTPLGITPLGRNTATPSAPSAPFAPPSTSLSSIAAGRSSAAEPPFLSSWFAKEAARRQEEKKSASNLVPPAQANNAPDSSAPPAPSAPPPLSPVPLFATQRPPLSSQTAAPTAATASSVAHTTPPLYALLPAATSPLLVAWSTVSSGLTSLLHSSASVVQSVIPAPRPPASVQETVARWHAAQRYKTVTQYGTAVSLLAVGVVMLLCVLVAPLPGSVLLFGVEAMTLPIGWLRWPVLVLSVVLLVLGAVALYRFYAPLPPLNNVSQKQRKLLGLPYTEDALPQSSTATTISSIAADTIQPADGIRRRNNAAVSMFASAPPVNRSSLFPSNDSPFPALSATSLFTPVKSPPLDSSGAMTDEKQLHQFFAEQASKQAQLQSTPASAYSASSYYSPYRMGGGLSSHTPPYATSVRTLPTMVRSSVSGAARSGRFALEDPRSDAESAERANEVRCGTLVVAGSPELLLLGMMLD